MKEARGAFFDKRKGFRFPVFALLLMLAGCGKAPIERVEWPVMGTIAAVQTRGVTPEDTATIVREVKGTFSKVEKLLNAHDPNSELSRLAPLPEAEILKRCDKLVHPCYELAFAWRETTKGAFNPRWRGADTVDLGAVAKGFAVDVAAERLGKVRFSGDVLLDLGGNLLAVKGDWRVGIAGVDESFSLEEGHACATSAEYYRGKHIVDGRTGQVVSNGVYSVTVVATEAMSADITSTTQFIFGPQKRPECLDEWRTCSILWVMRDGKKIEWHPAF